MLGHDIGIAPERGARGHGHHEHSILGQQLSDGAQDTHVIVQVLEHVEEANQLEACEKGWLQDIAANECGVGEPGPCVTQAVLEEVHADHGASGTHLLQGPQDITRPAADLEHPITHAEWLDDLAGQRRDQLVSGAEPDVALFGHDQRFVTGGVVFDPRRH